MPTNILMPALSPTMTEGTLARWLKKEGDTIAAGDVIAEIETDKATMEVEAVDEGVLGKILVADGTEGVKVNEPIAILVVEGEASPSSAASPPPASTQAVAAAAPQAEAGETGAPAAAQSAPAPTPSTPASTSTESAATATPAARNGHDAEGGRIFASPLARRMAQQAGIALAGLKGSGPNGRIVKADIDIALQRPAAAPVAAVPAAAPPSAAAPAAPVAATPAAAKPAPITAPHTLLPHTSMRRVIARRLAEASRDIPHFYVEVDICIDPLLQLRADLNARSAKDGPGAFKLSVNDLVIKAAAVALRRVPKVNASWTDAGVALYHDFDISIAVSIADGLITPIIRRADQKGLAAISSEMKDLAGRAKSGKLKPEEFQGGGFSISNMGMYGVSAFSAIINPPQAAILAVAAGEPRAVVRDGAIVVATMMTCTLSVDHRVVDGALGAEFLAAFKSIVEDPLSLML